MNTRRISAILTVLSVFLFMGLAAPKVQAAAYSFKTFDAPSTPITPTSINDSGQVTGYYSDDSGRKHGFLYSNGTLMTLDAPGVIYGTWPTSINNNGQVTGFYDDKSAVHGFVYSNGTFTTLDVPSAITTSATSINDSGQVAGYYSDGSTAHGFVYSNGTFTTLTVPGADSTKAYSINASGQVTGNYHNSSGEHGFVYSSGTFTTLTVPGATYIDATSINDSGQVTGHYFDSSGRKHGFLYSNGTFMTLDAPGAAFTWAYSINDRGQIAGTYQEAGVPGPGGRFPPYYGFVYSGGTFTTFDVLQGLDYNQATSINDNGQVTGYCFSGVHGFIATPVCVTPTVAVHTLTTAPNGWLRITGSITLDSIPLCALVLANGQFMFTCGDPLPKGDFDLTVPVDDQEQITLFGFSSDLAPFQQTFGSGSLPASTNTNSCATPTVTHTVAAAPHGGFRITGSITLGSDPLCALVLANGQFMFTCGDVLPKGDFDLTVPLDDQGKITLFGFSAGLAPLQQTFSPSSSSSTP